MGGIIGAIIRHPFVIIAVFLATCTGAATIHSRGANYDMSHRTMAPHNTPEFAVFEEFVEIFGDSNDLFLVALKADPLVSNKNLRVIERVTAKLDGLEATQSVTSLTNVKDIQGRDGALDVSAFLEAIPQPVATLAKLRRRFINDSVVGQNLISSDGSTTVIAVRLSEARMDWDQHFDYFDAVEKIVDAERRNGVELHIVGYPYISTVLIRHMIEDTAVFIPLSLLIMSTLLWLIFGQLRATFMPLVPVGVAATLTLGLLTACGFPMSLLTGQGVLTTLILVIGMADGIHLLNRYQEEISAQPAGERLIQLAVTVRHVGSACFLTSLTTALGFLSLAIADVPTVRDFGIFGAAGIGFAYLGAVVLLPAMIVLAERRAVSSVAATHTSGVLDRLLERTADLVSVHPRTILVSSVAVFVCAAACIPYARVESGPTGDLKKDDPAIRALNFLEENLGGAYPTEIVFEGGGPDSIKSPLLLEALDRIGEELVELPYVSKINSPTSFIKKMNRAMHDGSADAERIPETQEGVAQYLLLFEMAGSDNEFDRLVTYDYSIGRMTAMTKELESEEYDHLIETIDTLATAHMPPGTDLYASGESPVWNSASPILINTLVRSLYLAMPLIFLVTTIAFRSPKLGVLSALPNLLPITIGLGLLAPLDITLRFSTITAFPVAFGLAIDDTIHFLARYRSELERGASVEEAVRVTILTAGRAMVLTSLLLVAGFGSLFASNFLGMIHVATLNCIILLAALFGDLLLLPALLLLFQPKVGAISDQ
jgi:predicted RND superfamily exporter protein